MKHLLVRYKAKLEAAAENRRLVEGVIEALHEKVPQDVRYMVFELSDGTFVHVKTDLTEGAFDFAELPAFQAFGRGIGERCEERPKAAEARLVGTYGWASLSGDGR